jgi:hypothetical protein
MPFSTSALSSGGAPPSRRLMWRRPAPPPGWAGERGTTREAPFSRVPGGGTHVRTAGETLVRMGGVRAEFVERTSARNQHGRGQRVRFSASCHCRSNPSSLTHYGICAASSAAASRLRNASAVTFGKERRRATARSTSARALRRKTPDDGTAIPTGPFRGGSRSTPTPEGSGPPGQGRDSTRQRRSPLSRSYHVAASSKTIARDRHPGALPHGGLPMRAAGAGHRGLRALFRRSRQVLARRRSPARAPRASASSARSRTPGA